MLPAVIKPECGKILDFKFICDLEKFLNPFNSRDGEALSLVRAQYGNEHTCTDYTHMHRLNTRAQRRVISVSIT